MKNAAYKNAPMEILGTVIKPGTHHQLNLTIARLYTATKVEIPVIIERSKIAGPTVLITAGIHGDEINGVEIVRQLIAKKINKPARGTIICIPIINVFGFLDMARYFPDGKDLNRVFPGHKNGSLASQFAYNFVQHILPHADLCLDFHTGGASRSNAPQIRVHSKDDALLDLAKVFNAPFTIFSKNIPKSYRSTCAKMKIPMLLYEGGKSQSNDKTIAQEGVEGTQRVLEHLSMLRAIFVVPPAYTPTVLIQESRWIRSKYSGMLHLEIALGSRVEKGTPLAIITDPYGRMRRMVKAPHNGYIINVNQAPIIYQGDALFNCASEVPIAPTPIEPTSNDY